MTRFSAAAPVRLDFAGGWTDVPPYSAREGGVVVAAAVQLHAYAEVVPRDAGYILVAQDFGEALELESRGALAGDGALPLLRAGLRLLHPGPCALTTRSDAPPGSGLGSSGAIDVALVAALAAAAGRPASVREIADLACRLEGIEAGIPGGRQDQFAAAFGGFLRLTFRDPDASVERLVLDPEFAAELERRMLLCYTGASRFSGTTIERVMRAYERGEAAIAGALDGLRRVAEDMAEALRAADLSRVGALFTENWRLQQRLDPGMSTPEMARLEREMLDAGALGGKAAGSGAGGSMFFLAPDEPGPAREVVGRLGMRVLPVRWSSTGVRPC
ncbi:MAG: GHMP kinase [Gemmatimonadales bacterium]|nr:GHMP kinase [Gemmatimonadales bacterium]